MKEKRRSISTKIVGVTGLVIILVFAITGILINSTSSKIIYDLNKAILLNEAKAAGSYANEFFSKNGVLVEQMATNQEILKFMEEIKDRNEVRTHPNYRNIINTLKAIQKTDENLALVWLGLHDASYLVSHDEWDSPTTWVIQERPWYIEALASTPGEVFFTQPYLDQVTGEMIISIVQVIYNKNNESIGAVGIDLMIDKLVNTLEQYRFGETGFIFLITKQGEMVYHPDRDKILNFKILESEGALGEIGKAMILQQSGISTYQIEGEDKHIGYHPILSNHWSVGAVMNKSEFTKQILNINRIIIFIYSVGIAVIIVAVYFISRTITRPIIDLSQIVNKLSNYDLTLESENNRIKKYSDRKDEIGIISNALTKMQYNFISLIKDISNTSQQVAVSSEELTATSQQSSKAADEVAKVIEDIAMGASGQANDTEQGAVHITELGKLIEQDLQYIQELNASTNEVDILKNEGTEMIKDLVEKNRLSNMAANEINQVIINVNESVEKIENASQMIKNIAEQTNLLALNAAIEAARAGEAGRGFAVVSEEIRKLAEGSNTFTEEIAQVIKELIDKTENAVITMKNLRKLAELQTESVESTNEKFDGIANAIDKMKKAIMNINQSGKEMEGKKDEIIGIIENLSAISQENAASTEEASATIEEQTAAIEEIANASEGLGRLAQQMKDRILKFKL